MWKWVVKDYFAAFRWEKSKSWWLTGWWTVIYFSVFLPLIAKMFETPKDIVIYECVVLPVMLGFFSNGVHTMALPKVMYLCPLSERERREYIEKSCIFRLGIGSLMGIIGALVLLIAGYCDLVNAGLVIFNSISWAIIMCGFDRRKPDERAKERFGAEAYTVFFTSGMVETFAMIITAFSIMGVVTVLEWDTPVAWWIKWIFISSAVLIQLPLTVRLLKNWNVTIEHAASYEESFL